MRLNRTGAEAAGTQPCGVFLVWAAQMRLGYPCLVQLPEWCRPGWVLTAPVLAQLLRSLGPRDAGTLTLLPLRRGSSHCEVPSTH